MSIIKESPQVTRTVKLSVVLHKQMHTCIVKHKIDASIYIGYFNVLCCESEQTALKEFDKRVRELSEC